MQSKLYHHYSSPSTGDELSHTHTVLIELNHQSVNQYFILQITSQLGLGQNNHWEDQYEKKNL